MLQDPRFEVTRFAADSGIFRCYLNAMGGALATRAERPIKLAHLIEEQANSHGEDIKRLMGITSARLGIKTRLQGWKIVPAGTHEARKAAEATAREVGVKTGDSPAPWGSDNNRTQPDPEAFADHEGTMRVIALLHRPFAGWCQCKGGGFHPLAGERAGAVEPLDPIRR